MIKVSKFNVDETKLLLRASINGETSHGFKAKALGQWNDAGVKWTGIPNCDKCGGFFGIDKEVNVFWLPCRPTLELCEWRGGRIVIGNDKICVKSFRVIARNDDIPKDLIELSGGRLVREGENVESGNNNIAIDVGFTQSGGWCHLYGESSNKQSGGSCNMCDYSSNDQSAGWCYMHGHSRNNQSDGQCNMYDYSSNKQSGGYCEMYDYSKNNQSGGNCYMHGHSSNKQSGGNCDMHGGSNNEQSGGDCYMYRSSRNKQFGGRCMMHDHSSNKQSGGDCYLVPKIQRSGKLYLPEL